MIDTLTVVFKPELPILKVQAESISKNCQHIGIKNIFVVVNDDPQVVDLIDKTWWGPLQNCVRVLHRSALADWYVDDGWVSQQALKVLGAAHSENEFIMILDAKTIIVKPVTLDLVLPEGKPIGGTMPIPEVFDTSAKIVGHLFDVKLTKNGGSSGVPFFFHGQTIRKMLDEIHSRTGEKFSDWFQKQGMVTEYLLYVGFNLLLHGSMDKFYSLTNPYTVCNLCRNQTHQIDEKLKLMHDPDNLTVSVHRYAWAQMSQDQRNHYKNLLLTHGLATAQDLV